MSWILPALPLVGVFIVREDVIHSEVPNDPKVLLLYERYTLYVALIRISIAIAAMLLTHIASHAKPSPGLPYGEPPLTMLPIAILLVIGLVSGWKRNPALDDVKLAIKNSK